MRIAMMYTWQGIAGGSKGLVKKVSKSGKSDHTVLEVKFDYGETRTVPLASTISEQVYISRNLYPIIP